MTTNDQTTAAAVTSPVTTSPATTGAADKSVGDLVRSLSEDLSRLVRDEIRLAQAEVGEKAKKAGIGIGAFGGAGVVALYGLGVLITAGVLGLAAAVPAWLAALIVAVVLFVIAAVAALVGRKKLREAAPPVPTRAIETTKADVAEIKESIHR